MMPSSGDVDEVVQRVNIVAWRKAHAFEEGTNFRAWVSRIARFEVLAFARECGRDRHTFSVDFVHSLADEAERQLRASDEQRTALRKCMGRLGASQQELLRDRYGKNASVKEIAKRMFKYCPFTCSPDIALGLTDRLP